MPLFSWPLPSHPGYQVLEILWPVLLVSGDGASFRCVTYAIRIFSTYPANCIFPNCFFPTCIFQICILSNCILLNCILSNCILSNCIFSKLYFLRCTSLFKHIQGELCQGKHLCREIWTTFSPLAFKRPKLSRRSFPSGTSGGLCR